MTRSKLIQIVSEKQASLSYKEAEMVVKHIFDQLSDALENGNRIEIRGFGSFSLRYRTGGLARNPKTGVFVRKAGKHTPYFRPGKEMRDRVNHSAELFPIKVDAESL